ncbi:minor capsid protein [Bacillus timonensis]|uniref:Minor capsid protein n=1 Tax=Bacillus timonensis TaxID=1033734 RepID=A0A4S3PKK6_9BACI|nr:phage minor capsid protein [Bacillus timonensis]THE09939.1 minor capsid protein [Bacillus timonensis]
MTKTEQLIKLYTVASEEIRLKINSLEDGIAKRKQQQLLEQILSIIRELQQQGIELATEIIEDSYLNGSNEAVNQLISQGVDEVEKSLTSVIHQEAVQQILYEVFYRILEATDHMSADVKERIETIVRRANERSLVQGISRRKATKDAIAELNNKGITGIIYKNGTKMPVEKYIANVIHYHQRQAHVDGSINRMVDNGEDLVYVNFVGVTCERCAQYQGRVYSVSGKDKRFPKLDIRPPYHGHCVHNATPWVERYHDEDEIEKAINDSNRPFTDNRTELNIRKYEQLQQEKSRQNETRNQWIRYKSRMPDMPDLKTFASQKARNTKKYNEWQEDYRKIGQSIKS